MSEFLYLFRGGDARDANASPERMQEHMGKWMKWMEDLGKQGKFSGGLPLKPEGKTVQSQSVVTDGPYAEGKEMVGGYLIVKANDLNEATEMSKGCPIFEFDGTVEIREIQSMEM
jgi:hypothetical protein